jgi:SAM-dependent methyltransferase
MTGATLLNGEVWADLAQPRNGPPAPAQTISGLSRLNKLQACIVAVLEDQIPGDVVAAGVPGGAAVFLKAVLEAYGDRERKLWVADRIAIPSPHDDGPQKEDGSNASCPEAYASDRYVEAVRAVMARYGLLDERVGFLQKSGGQLSAPPADAIAILVLCGATYESAKATLSRLYPKMADGGFVIVDGDASPEGFRRGAEEFHRQHGIEAPIEEFEGAGVYWRSNVPHTYPRVTAAAEYYAITLESPATAATFDEEAYLRRNPDVEAALRAGRLKSGLQHFTEFGQQENRRMRFPLQRILSHKREKIERIKPILRPNLHYQETDGMLDCLTDSLRQSSGITSTSATSSNPYEVPALEAIERLRDGLILDCGSGRRSVYYSNVVNFEIVDYDTTDVRGVGEYLPFRTSSFDAVFSFAVLEHVKDPFRCASEICRVLKPGGFLLCVVPFLQPLHGYPSHYYNMSHQGLHALFAHQLHIESQTVPEYGLPIWSLTWILKSWAEGLTGSEKTEFLSQRVSDLTGPPEGYLRRGFVANLSGEKNFELASVTWLKATKPF